MGSVSEVVALLLDRFCLGFCGLTTEVSPQLLALGLEHPQVRAEDELFQKAWHYTLALLKYRMRRMLWVFRGWPGQLALLLDPHTARACMARFKTAWEAFTEAQQQTQTPSPKTIIAKSCFTQPVVLSMVRLAQANNFGDPSEEMLPQARRMFQAFWKLRSWK